MNIYEVEAIFKVRAEDADDAIARIRALLKPISYTLQSGIRGCSILDDAATEVTPD